MTSGRALRAITLGTGDHPANTGTLVSEFHLSGAPVVLLSPVAPIALSLALAWCVSRRLGESALERAIRLSVVAVSLGFRLVFEEYLSGYYFLAFTVSLVLIEVVRGRVRLTVVAWLAGLAPVTLRIGIEPSGGLAWGGGIQNNLPLVIALMALRVILVAAVDNDELRSSWPWFAGATVAVIIAAPAGVDPLNHLDVLWFWQVLIVAPGILLAAEPLITRARQLRAISENAGASSSSEPSPTDWRSPTPPNH